MADKHTIAVRYFQGAYLVMRDMSLPVIPRVGDLICTDGWNHRRRVENVILSPDHARVTVCCTAEEVKE